MAMDIAHPWPEWVPLMELLLHRGHLDPSAFAGSEAVQGLKPFLHPTASGDVAELGGIMVVNLRWFLVLGLCASRMLSLSAGSIV